MSVVVLEGDISSSSAHIFSGNSQNYLQGKIQQPASNLPELASETTQQTPANVQETPAQQQQLEQKEQKLDRELEIEPKNPEGVTGEEVPGPENQLDREGVDDDFPVQPPDEEIQLKL